MRISQKIKEMSAEKAIKLAKVISFGIFAAITLFLMLLILSCSGRIRALTGEFYQAPAICAGIVVIILLLLHFFLLPSWSTNYPDYSDSSKVASDVKFVTTLRLRCVAVGLVLSLLALVLLKVLWPIGTVPKELSTNVFFSSDGKKLLSEEFGTMAFLSDDEISGEKMLWACRRVNAYGPFKFGGELDEIILNRISVVDVISVDTNQYLLGGYSTERFLVKFVHYEDGDWMFVKEFAKGENEIALEQNAVLELTAMLSSDVVLYEVHKFSNEELKLEGYVKETLFKATAEILEWTETADGITYLTGGYDE